MAALDFPASPVDGQTYTANGAVWTYNLAKTRWYVTNFSNAPIGYTGSQGLIGFTGSAAVATSINATNDTATTTLYPVMVAAAGSAQVAKVSTGKVSFNALTGHLGIGTDAGDSFNANAQIRLQGTGSEYIQIKSDGTGVVGLLLGDTTDAFTAGIVSNQAANDNLLFYANNAQRMSIDSAGLITQINATSGSGNISGLQTFRLAADGTAIGPTISNFFGANSAISLEAASMYEITIHTFFLKTTASTLTWTLTASSAPTSVVARNISTPIAGTSGVGIVNTVTSLATASTAFAATGSLTTGVNHAFEFRIKVLTNLATNLRLNATQVSGTITPRNGSYYTVKKISTTLGTFVA